MSVCVTTFWLFFKGFSLLFSPFLDYILLSCLACYLFAPAFSYQTPWLVWSPWKKKIYWKGTLLKMWPCIRIVCLWWPSRNWFLQRIDKQVRVDTGPIPMPPHEIGWAAVGALIKSREEETWCLRWFRLVFTIWIHAVSRNEMLHTRCIITCLSDMCICSLKMWLWWFQINVEECRMNAEWRKLCFNYFFSSIHHSILRIRQALSQCLWTSDGCFDSYR